MKSWRTTAGGIGAILAGLGLAVKQWVAGDIPAAVATAVGAISAGLALIAARDNKVPSEAVPAARDKAEEIKGETERFVR